MKNNLVWEKIENYDNYVVSNTGLVKSFDREFVDKLGRKRLVKGHILKQQKDRDGYLYVYLHGDKTSKFMKVHRLVAMAFLPNPDNLPEVNHKDENKQNNCVDNLEWCKHYYNMMYGTCRKRQSIKIKGANNPNYKHGNYCK